MVCIVLMVSLPGRNPVFEEGPRYLVGQFNPPCEIRVAAGYMVVPFACPSHSQSQAVYSWYDGDVHWRCLTFRWVTAFTCRKEVIRILQKLSFTRAGGPDDEHDVRHFLGMQLGGIRQLGGLAVAAHDSVSRRPQPCQGTAG
jgi:hypothetical protein